MFTGTKEDFKLTTQSPNKPLQLSALPRKMQQKYKNSILFEQLHPSHKKKFEIDSQKLKQRKIDKQKTLEEKLDEFVINSTEEKYLLNLFDKLVSKSKDDSFGKAEIVSVLKKLEMDMSNSEIELMIWEFDENLDKRISRKEFITMYKKCLMDKTAAEPKKLFHLVQFLMYCQNDNYRITVEDTLELLYVRAQFEAAQLKINQKFLFEDSIKIIFGQDYEKERNGVEKQINFAEYLEKINKKAIERRKKQIEKLKSQLRY